MSMIVNNNFELSNISNVLDFVKPLLIEGYSVSINKVHKEYLFDGEDVFTIIVGKKGCKIAIYDPEEKACDNE